MKKTFRQLSCATVVFAATGVATLTATAAPAAAAPATAPAAISAASPIADPNTVSTEILPGVRYTGNVLDQSVLIQTGLGTLTTVGGQFQVKDVGGNILAGAATLPSQPKAEEAVTVTEQAVATTPNAEPVGQAQNIYSQEEFNSALGLAATQFGLATGIGGLAGGLIGAAGGCVVGATIGFALVPAFFLASGPAGCLVGAGLGATVGPWIGAGIVGIPVGIASAVQMYNTLNAPAPAPANAPAAA
ncbi:hypothetical protein IU436_29955 [Nocardia farcinica]|uniref:hypothetical protein n=1 Tax=Nocardia farcinica TaxID=37329 RepID=UPI001894DA76|nr:hypothetical protein [Nocardia farcinica]MBF6422829.1 hypothetical protein [Nocardia farcinica]MBF6434544.1 hypothetical protein [Nocardia farcinica]MBF6505648.1 hypothetical protein [Nocardia farcinica]